MVNEEYTKTERSQLCKKITDYKYELSQTEIPKSGKNKFQGYSYFELKDFMPYVHKLNKKHGLTTCFEVKNSTAYLTVIDTDSMCSKTWEHQLPQIKKTSTDKQGRTTEIKETEIEKTKGALETYARRYLYLAFLELSDGDAIDNGDLEKPKTGTKKAPKKPVRSVIS